MQAPESAVHDAVMVLVADKLAPKHTWLDILFQAIPGMEATHPPCFSQQDIARLLARVQVTCCSTVINKTIRCFTAKFVCQNNVLFLVVKSILFVENVIIVLLLPGVSCISCTVRPNHHAHLTAVDQLLCACACWYRLDPDMLMLSAVSEECQGHHLILRNAAHWPRKF